ncbi:MAG: glutathione S-transferase [Betaproteobacteria bacterium RIFCSPLOWO2_12_FULL_65_14]|nr:MAG: glutathione S-transferase [Betaproteobacteria bacterium RIFCSPLOWO2_12_FULL_65_14]
MLKIWGRLNSVNVKKALWAMEELGLPYHRIDAGMQFGVNKTPEYLKMNPTGLVPTIDEDGFVLWESHTIVRYLAAKHGAGTLWPTDLKVRADAERWMDWTFTFLAAFRPVFWGLVRTPVEKRDMKAIEESRKKCAELLAIPDQALAGRSFLAGEAFTMGDIPLGCHVQLWMRLPIERPAHPHLTVWFNRLCARPAFKKIVDIELS